MAHNRDDSPLYIFDSTFDEDKHAKRILEDYSVPAYFDEDLLSLVGERRRPPYRCVPCVTTGVVLLLMKGRQLTGACLPVYPPLSHARTALPLLASIELGCLRMSMPYS